MNITHISRGLDTTSTQNTSAGSDTEVASPCIRVCKIDKLKSLCVACYRTLDEIGAWRDASMARRTEIMESVRIRQAGAR